MRRNGQLVQSKTVANIEDFTVLVRCGAVQSATATTPCRSPYTFHCRCQVEAIHSIHVATRFDTKVVRRDHCEQFQGQIPGRNASFTKVLTQNTCHLRALLGWPVSL